MAPFVLTSCPATRGVQSCFPLVHQSLSGLTPAYLAYDIKLVVDSGRRLLRSLSRQVHITSLATGASRVFPARLKQARVIPHFHCSRNPQ